MIFTQQTIDMILSAESKVLGTYSPETGVHCAPVSTIKIIDNKIMLLNYFMTKTVQNIQHNNQVSLVCWTGFEGVQIKGTVDYQTTGNLFDDMTTWAQEAFPTRVVSGVFVITPHTILDVSARTDKHPKEFYTTKL